MLRVSLKEGRVVVTSLTSRLVRRPARFPASGANPRRYPSDERS